MSKHRPRRAQPAPAPVNTRLDEVADMASELAALWRVMPAALARDSAGTLNDDRHSTGARRGSASPGDLTTMEAAALIEVGVSDIAAQAIRILGLNPARARTTATMIAELVDWFRVLDGKRMPLAHHLYGDLRSWLSQARIAVGTQHRDTPLGVLCPDHRDELPVGPVCRDGDCDHASCSRLRNPPGQLRVVGAVAKLAPTLLAGPPAQPDELPPIGPACVDCMHATCAAVRADRRIYTYGRPTDWLLNPEGEPVWSPLDGTPPFTWENPKTVRCPKCRQTWSTTTERRLLARRLAALGVARADGAALLT